MTKKHQPKQVIPPPGKADYKGRLSSYQVNGSSHQGRRYQKVEYDSFNNVQNFLYHRALFGLSVYSQDEIKEMHWEKRERIKKVHKRTARVLNLWKQEIINHLTNSFFLRLFPKSPFVLELTSRKDIDPDFKCSLSFRTLNVTKKEIVDKLLLEGVLPHNFYELKPEEVCK